MSKKAKEVVEAAPKFHQPWQGFLSFSVVVILAYVTYTWFLHPVWGLLTRMATSNAFVAYSVMSSIYPQFGSFALLASINNPNLTTVYPLGYLENWVSFFVFCIVWFVAIALLARPFTPPTSRLRKQPWGGLLILVLSMIFAFITWYILGVVFHWKAVEMALLGTVGFLVFPIWVTLFGYWPFVPKRAGTHAMVRGAIYITLSWVFTFLLNWIIENRVWSNSMGVAFTQYLLGNPLSALTPLEPYYFWISILLSIIVANTAISQLNLMPTMTQPMRGLVSFILGIVLGLIIWGIVTLAVGPSYQTVPLSPIAVPALPSPPFPAVFSVADFSPIASFPYINHGAVAAFLAFPLVTLLFGNLTFGMWPWARWGKWGNLIWVIMAFIIGTIVFFIMMVWPGWANTITGANIVNPASGLMTLELVPWAVGILLFQALGAIPAPFIPVATMVVVSYFFTGASTVILMEGTAAVLGTSLLASWILTVLIFYLLAYEGFEHWPMK